LSEYRHAEPERLDGEIGVVAADQAGLFEGANAPQTRRRRYADPPRQLDIRHPSVILEQIEDLPIDPVQFWPAHALSRCDSG
jgi:hypothetical protein